MTQKLRILVGLALVGLTVALTAAWGLGLDGWLLMAICVVIGAALARVAMLVTRRAGWRLRAPSAFALVVVAISVRYAVFGFPARGQLAAASLVLGAAGLFLAGDLLARRSGQDSGSASR